MKKRILVAIVLIVAVIATALTVASRDTGTVKLPAPTTSSKPASKPQGLLLNQSNTWSSINADTLNPNYAFNGTTGWSVLGGTSGASYSATQNSDVDPAGAGSGSIQVVPGFGASYYYSGELTCTAPGNCVSKYQGHPVLLQTTGVAVTPGEAVTLSADVLSTVWPPNEVIVGLIGSGPTITCTDSNGVVSACEKYIQPDGDPSFSFGSENGAAAPLQVNKWANSAKTIIIPSSVTSVRVQIYTYSDRPFFIDNIRLIRGSDRIVPPAVTKQGFTGQRMSFDSQGRVSLYNPVTNVMEPKFPLAIHGWYSDSFNAWADAWPYDGVVQPSEVRPVPTAPYIVKTGTYTYTGFQSAARYAAMKAKGWDINVWGAFSLDQLQKVAQGGMQAMYALSGVICRTKGAGDCAGSLDSISSMQSKISSMRAAVTPYANGVSPDEAFVGGWLDNENYGAAWQNFKNVMDAFKNADKTLANLRGGPIVMLHTSSGAGIGAWNNADGSSIADMTGVYVDPANNLRLAELMGNKAPAKLCQINFPASMRAKIGECLAGGGQMAIYFGDGPADSCCPEKFFELTNWSYDMPQLRADLSTLTPIIQGTDVALSEFEIQNTSDATNKGKNQVSPIVAGMKDVGGNRYMFFGNNSSTAVTRRIQLANSFPYQVGNVYNTLTGAVVATVTPGQKWFDVTVTGYNDNGFTGGMLTLTLAPQGGTTVPPTTVTTVVPTTTTTTTTIPTTTTTIAPPLNTECDDPIPAFSYDPLVTTGESNGWMKYGPNDPLAVGDFQLGNHVTSKAGAKVTLRVSGTKIDLYGAKQSNAGQFTVSLDGGTAVTVDSYSASPLRNTLLWSSPTLTDGVHTIVVTVSGSHSTSSTGDFVIIDRAVVGLGADITPCTTTAAPVVTINSPSESSTVTKPVTINGVITDDGAVTSAEISIYSNGQWWNGSAWQTPYDRVPLTITGTGTPSATWSYTFNPPETSGVYAATVVGFDNESLYSFSTNRVFSIAVTPPSTTTTTTTIPINPLCVGGVRVETENGTITSPWTVSSLSAAPGTPGGFTSGVQYPNSTFSGTGYVVSASSTGGASWTVNVPSAGYYSLTFKARTSVPSTVRSFSVNGVAQSNVTWASSGVWIDIVIGTFLLNGGNNTIAFGSVAGNSGQIEWDKFDVCPSSPPTTTTTAPTTTTTIFTGTTTTQVQLDTLNITLTGVTANAVVSGAGFVTAEVSTSASCNNNIAVVFYVDGKVKNVDTTAPYRSTAWSLSNLKPNTVHSVYASATDGCDRTRVSATVLIKGPVLVTGTTSRIPRITSVSTTRKPR